MSKSKIKLGKRPARVDTRTLKLTAIIRKELLPPIPSSFNVDALLNMSIDNPVFSNDTWGDCVMAGRAHMTRRFEAFEQKQVIPITDQDVLNEYWGEQQPVTFCGFKRKPDNGLVMLDSLNAWRKGWTAAGKPYNIYAYAGINWLDKQEVLAAGFLLRGLYVGFRVPQSALDQFNAGQVWDIVPNDGGIVGGHAIYIPIADFTSPGGETLTCVTWGKPQKMTLPFFQKQVDEAYAVVDNKDNWLGGQSPVDVNQLNTYLKEITGGV